MQFQTTALILAAGLGTRLRPLTNDKPKALVPLQEKPLLLHAIEHIRAFGIKNIVINVHHFAQQVIDFIESIKGSMEDMNFQISDESDLLLDTGGAIKKAKDLLLVQDAKQVLVYNADILSNIDFEKMEALLHEKGSSGVLAVRNRNSSRYLHFDENNHLAAWSNPSKNLVKFFGKGDMALLKKAAFSGLHLFQINLLDKLPNAEVFSIIDWYLDLAANNIDLSAYWHDEDYWFDMGKPENLQEARNFYFKYR